MEKKLIFNEHGESWHAIYDWWQYHKPSRMEPYQVRLG